MAEEEEIRDGLIGLVERQTNVFYPIFCTVNTGSIDINNKSCDVTPINEDAPILGVKIMEDSESGKGMFLIPKEESTVVINMLDKDNAYVVMFSELEKILIEVGDQTIEIENGSIVFNGGNFNGLVKVAELVQKLNKIENDLNTLKQIFSTGWVPVPNDGGAALKVAAATWSGALITPITTQTDLENTVIKHGG